MRHILLRDQAALRAVVEGTPYTTEPSGRRVYLTRECPDCHGNGGHPILGAGPFGIHGWAPCETCGGGGSVDEEN